MNVAEMCCERFRAHGLRSLCVGQMLDRKRSPNTHTNPETVRRMHDRRKIIHVNPPA